MPTDPRALIGVLRNSHERLAGLAMEQITQLLQFVAKPAGDSFRGPRHLDRAGGPDPVPGGWPVRRGRDHAGAAGSL